jgi:hypothetical protein
VVPRHHGQLFYFIFPKKIVAFFLIIFLEILGNSWNGYVSVELNIAKPQTKSATKN